MMPPDPLTPPAPAAPNAGNATRERRLHPLSWLFVLLAQLREFAIPLLVVLVFGGRAGNDDGWWNLIGLVGAAALVLVALGRYVTYRFRVGSDQLVIRSGLLQKNVRHIPFARIHNVGLHQNLLHRLFGVAEVRLESAGGAKPEAQMRVLALADAHALEALIRRRGADDATTAAPVDDAGTVLLALTPGELLRMGLISNRGMVVVGAAFAVLFQAAGETMGELLNAWGRIAFGYANDLHLGMIATGLALLGLLLAVLVTLRVLSVALALLQYHGFTLREIDARLSVERGLLTRIRSSAPRHRIQAWSLRETLLQRAFGRRSLRVDTASSQAGEEDRSLRELVPIAAPATIDALIVHLLPHADWNAASTSTSAAGTSAASAADAGTPDGHGLDTRRPDTHELRWRPLHPRAWRRRFAVPTALLLIAVALLTWRFGWPALAGVLGVPLLLWRARRWAACARYAVGAELIAVHEGWLSRHWRFAELGKLQAVRWTQSPLDRRHGMATLWLDTAGAGAMDAPLRIRYLPAADARALLDRLAGEIARRALRW